MYVQWKRLHVNLCLYTEALFGAIHRRHILIQCWLYLFTEYGTITRWRYIQTPIKTTCTHKYMYTCAQTNDAPTYRQTNRQTQTSAIIRFQPLKEPPCYRFLDNTQTIATPACYWTCFRWPKLWRRTNQRRPPYCLVGGTESPWKVEEKSPLLIMKITSCLVMVILCVIKTLALLANDIILSSAETLGPQWRWLLWQEAVI